MNFLNTYSSETAHTLALNISWANRLANDVWMFKYISSSSTVASGTVEKFFEITRDEILNKVELEQIDGELECPGI